MPDLHQIFVVGQRWISQTEPQLGLGVVVAASGRRVTISFPAVEEERIYAAHNAALGRVAYRVDDQIATRNDLKLTVICVQESAGVLLYECLDGAGIRHTASELDLSAFVQFTSPRQRLFSGQLDSNTSYELRIATLYHRDAWQRSKVRGLLGCRAQLLPHQIYVAAQVGARHAPRVLLADEVGLGKTIEAGMIVHQQLQTGRASRILIIVPSTLLHQWMVELLRRFNLHFSLFDQDRFEALAEDPSLNPFDSEQLILTSLEFLSDDERALDAADSSTWDLLVVDEAHHLHWTEQSSSTEYQCIERLASNCQGLLLLTATPEQAGQESHFARLRLLDPARFHDLSTFQLEQARYPELNTLVQKLLHGPDLTPEELDAVQTMIGSDPPRTSDQALDVAGIVRQLLDRHGTGRVLFRNTRAAIPHFPERRLHSYPLAPPELYRTDNRGYGEAGLTPEADCDETLWIAQDPRVSWLQDLLKRLRPEKVLVICARAATAIALEFQLQMRAGIRSASFHEDLSLIERDRAAAWFAEQEDGAQTLICSEIGSEGRNFQFSHHLVLFDLPLNPDLLEQRIGRLDRIGQDKAIEIHVPYLQNTAQEVLYHWYHEGVDLFRKSCAAAYSIHEHFSEALSRQLDHPDGELATLIQQTRQFTELTTEAMHKGRDPLLELNSCDMQRAQNLIDEIEAAQDNDVLLSYLELLLNELGIDFEVYAPMARVLRPAEHMLPDHLPGLKSNGTTVTLDREQALSRDDLSFMSWEQPLLNEAMDFILNSELGNATVASIQVRGLPPGTLLVEAVFTVNCIAAAHLELDRYLPLSPIRILFDHRGNNLHDKLSHRQLNQLCSKVKKNTAQAIIKRVQPQLETILDQSEQNATSQLAGILSRARSTMIDELQGECDRLIALKTVNPSIRDEEIDFLRDRIRICTANIDRAQLQLQGLRVVVNA